MPLWQRRPIAAWRGPFLLMPVSTPAPAAQVKEDNKERRKAKMPKHLKKRATKASKKKR